MELYLNVIPREHVRKHWHLSLRLNHEIDHTLFYSIRKNLHHPGSYGASLEVIGFAFNDKIKNTWAGLVYPGYPDRRYLGKVNGNFSLGIGYKIIKQPSEELLLKNAYLIYCLIRED